MQRLPVLGEARSTGSHGQRPRPAAGGQQQATNLSKWAHPFHSAASLTPQNIPEEEGTIATPILQERRRRSRGSPGSPGVQEAGVPTRAVGLQRAGAGALTKGQSPQVAQWKQSTATRSHTPHPAQVHPHADPPPITCPCTMAFNRASTACRASGGRSGCNRSATAFHSASTACCHQQKGTTVRGYRPPPLKAQNHEQRTEQDSSFDSELTPLKPTRCVPSQPSDLEAAGGPGGLLRTTNTHGLWPQPGGEGGKQQARGAVPGAPGIGQESPFRACSDSSEESH